MTDARFSSEVYWRNRYKAGRNSGSGSYGRLAVYKAHVVNLIVHQNDISNVIELGCGDGNQAELFEIDQYHGIDVSPHVIEHCKEKFKNRSDWIFSLSGSFSKWERPSILYDMSISLDVIYHLVEDDKFEEYMNELISFSKRWVLIYSSDEDRKSDVGHVRHRKYSRWLEENAPEFRLYEHWRNPYETDDPNGTLRTTFAFFSLYKRGE